MNRVQEETSLINDPQIENDIALLARGADSIISVDELRAVLAAAEALEELYRQNISCRVFSGGIAVSNFRDQSTRTRFSFASASALLGLQLQDQCNQFRHIVSIYLSCFYRAALLLKNLLGNIFTFGFSAACQCYITEHFRQLRTFVCHNLPYSARTYYQNSGHDFLPSFLVELSLPFRNTCTRSCFH